MPSTDALLPTTGSSTNESGPVVSKPTERTAAQLRILNSLFDAAAIAAVIDAAENREEEGAVE